VRSLDAAMQSRIHLAIQYTDLDVNQRIAIYKNRLDLIPDDEIEDREALKKALESSSLVKRSNKANGRQIRNIVTGARAWARKRGEKMTMEHLLKVDDTTTLFNDAMSELIHKQRAKNEVEYDK
jgi:hypothetical protein